ncbi:MAG: VOC family protein [Roseovarius sp.]
MLRLDHFAVAAETLEAGRAYAEESLGVALRPGGQHAHYGTHNMLLGLEDGLYMEVIAVDPEAPAPGYARWFDLDRFEGRPRPTNWICNTDDLGALVARFPQAGAPVPLARGALRWQMAVPEDGRLPWDNLFPAVIEWQCAQHPAQILPASGCRLDRLVVTHPDAQALEAALAPVLADSRVAFETGAAALRAEMTTPRGTCVLA